MGKRTVTVNGTGRAAVSPDVVRLDLRVGHDADDVAAALAGAGEGISKVGAVVRDHGVADADIRTLDAGVNQRWDNTGVAVGFTAQQRLAVTVRRLESVAFHRVYVAPPINKAVPPTQLQAVLSGEVAQDVPSALACVASSVPALMVVVPV